MIYTLLRGICKPMSASSHDVIEHKPSCSLTKADIFKSSLSKIHALRSLSIQ